MSICRRAQTGHVYIYNCLDLFYECNVCSIREGAHWHGRTRLHVLWHAIEHKLRERSHVTIRPILYGLWHNS